MSRRDDSCRRAVLLALLASEGPLELDELLERAVILPSEMIEAVSELKSYGLVVELGSGCLELDKRAHMTLLVVGRGAAPLDRHVAEALELRERGA